MLKVCLRVLIDHMFLRFKSSLTFPKKCQVERSIDLFKNGSLFKYSFISTLKILTSLVWEERFF